ncbi:sensor histidine kinase [Chitinophaga alhagiae]|uniref:sensor histidine kinase n=1 Tax=Chitinophaga alhagiae TaxID=2203219 RepID=UPI000E5B3524|nr:sensor histidine kinase [Chitinophaga alhagiae]
MVSIRNIFRNRLVIISMHIVAWTCIFLFPFFAYRIQVADRSFFIKEAINTLFLVGLFYLNVYVLIPKFFTLKRIGIYIACVLGLIIFIAIQQAVVEYRFMTAIMDRPPFFIAAGDSSFMPEHPFEIPVPEGEDSAVMPTLAVGVTGMAAATNVIYRGEDGPGPAMALRTRHGDVVVAGGTQMMAFRDSMLRKNPVHWRKRLFRTWRAQGAVIDSGVRIKAFPPAFAETIPARPFHDGVFMMHFFFPEMLRKSGTFALLMLFMSGFIKIAMEWFKSEKQREALKVANLNAELKFLKSQINPHFLFNSLNTIYSLAHRRSPETEHALVKLSTIMRYMIYQSNEDKVPLQTELRYLQDYIDIQRLRMARNIPVEVTVEGEDGADLEIAPMLLIPFVENAFKHGISYKEPSYIHIRMHIGKDGIFQLVVRNRLFRQRMAEKGGVGLNNALKRLSLLYADAHTITVREHGEEFIADLKIALKHDEVFSA